MAFPEVNEVETPLGVADTIWATSSTHIGMRGTFVINRVSYRIRLDLHLRDGKWQRGDKDDWSAIYHALMVDREWDYPNGRPRPDTSSSARGKAETALVPWLAEFAEGDGAELVRLAGVERHKADIDSARQKIAKLEAEVSEAREALAKLEEGH